MADKVEICNGSYQIRVSPPSYPGFRPRFQKVGSILSAVKLWCTCHNSKALRTPVSAALMCRRMTRFCEHAGGSCWDTGNS
eukprot:2427897-Rhodomonas_salina.1